MTSQDPLATPSTRTPVRAHSTRVVRTAQIAAPLILLALIATPRAHAWGHQGHAIITRNAAAAMPAPLRDFFNENQEALADHSSDPDEWRKSDDPKHAGEHERHFLDIDYKEFGTFPFNGLPRNYDEAVEKFGEETFKKYGVLPWRINNYLKVVEEAMRSGDADAIVRACAAHSHYVQDAHQPLHVVMNFDGQLTGQKGIHGRWEWDMVVRHEDDLAAMVAERREKVSSIDDTLEAAFDIILDSYAEHFDLLNADRNASDGIQGELTESDEYFDRLWDYSRELCADRMAAAATLTARYWLTAWERAGRPVLPVKGLGKSGSAPRARDLGIQIGALPTGPNNAITDVPGVRVGHTTINTGHGHDALRTGVTAIVPTDDIWNRNVAAATFAFNGNGEVTGAAYVDEVGWLEVPILLTGTLNVPRVADGVITWMTQQHPEMGLTDDVVLPLVAECSDAWLTNAPDRPVSDADVIDAINGASPGPVQEGAVGAGTGMVCYSFKGGCGTASRLVADYALGAFVLANGGRRSELRVDGVPVGRSISDLMPETLPHDGSFIIVIATDAPLTSRQLKRLCKRATFGLARTGTAGRHGSGDFMIAFSTAVVLLHSPEDPIQQRTALADGHLNDLFTATVEASEEAIVNALVAGTTVTGRDGHTAHAIPKDRLRQVMRDHGRLQLTTTQN